MSNFISISALALLITLFVVDHSIGQTSNEAGGDEERSREQNAIVKETDPDFAKLKGKWKVVAFQQSPTAKRATPGRDKQFPIMITGFDEKSKGSLFSLLPDGEFIQVTGRFLSVQDSTNSTQIRRINSRKSVKEIDVTDLFIQYKNQPATLGIYKLDGDQVKFCFAEMGQPRPTNFSLKGKTNHCILELKRYSPDEKVRTPLTNKDFAHRFFE